MMPTPHWMTSLALALGMLPASQAGAQASRPADLLAAYSQEAGRPANAEQGRRFFTSTHGGEWSCASCHQNTPSTPGRHAATGKAIAPLAPAFNPERFTQASKVEKWFRRNCRDVLSRECSSSEKADVLAWLITLRP